MAGVPQRTVLGRRASAGSDIAGRIRQAGERLGVQPTVSGKSFWFRVRLSPERTQDVAVQVSRGETPGDELVLVYTECGPADARLYETLLRKNLTLRAGAFAIRDIDGHAHFAMVDTVAAPAATADDLARRIERIAAQAEVVESVLAKQEQNHHG